MNDIDAANRDFGRGAAVRFEASPLGGPVALLTAGAARAVVALRGAQVLSYRPPGEPDVLWLSPVARLDGTKALRGGIPVCWPWFGPHPSDAHLPAHGVARTAAWQVVASAASDGRVRLALALGAEVIAAAGLPAGVALTLEVALAGGLEVTLRTTNGGRQPVAISEALHTYLAVSDIGTIEVRGLDGAGYLDQIDAGRQKRAGGQLRFDGEVDRIYQSAGTVSVLDAGAKRTLVVEKRGSGSTVVWNPWAAKAARLGDVGEEGWRRFVCIEAANAGGAPVVVAPGETHALATRLSVTR